LSSSVKRISPSCISACARSESTIKENDGAGSGKEFSCVSGASSLITAHFTLCQGSQSESCFTRLWHLAGRAGHGGLMPSQAGVMRSGTAPSFYSRKYPVNLVQIILGVLRFEQVPIDLDHLRVIVSRRNQVIAAVLAFVQGGII
jgi:hypothetical protein